MSLDLIFETHSISTDNEAGIATGWLPGRLSETGRRLALELGGRHRDDSIATVFVSDLRRAVETAEIAFSTSGIPIFQDQRLRECNYGDLNGMPTARLVAARAKHVAFPYPNGQSYTQVVEQMRGFLHDLAENWQNKRIVVISHSANRWALDCLLHHADLMALVDTPFNWQPGWLYTIPDGWDAGAESARVQPAGARSADLG